MKPIEEFSDNELLEELSKRFDDFIVAGRKDGYGNSEQCLRRRFWKGDYDVCIGLIFGTALDCLIKNWGVSPDDISNDDDDDDDEGIESL